MTDDHRSGCPINLSLEVFGDKWSLLIVRDMIFGGKRHFRELLRSQEGISSNILADRLKTLVEMGMLTKRDDPSHKQKAIYSLTEKTIALVPIMAHLGAWGRRYLPVTEELSIRAQLMEEGGPELWDRFMDELRVEHLGATPAASDGPTVRQTLQAAYEQVMARKAKAREPA
ncbi:winged helix-turn-helix transcriptional regulator [Sinorhizobium terangae]|uniref:Transcriptional regulator n=1 Tax=Sinorhizobium terangae TaxID=110322 RepID=A0A6N7LB84_SINTE|nr:helix-turn-helix domain-containing protein [Sinorhizobium terangae]MBB4183850.1 DNA-binding HxlR family transcriptional regulator [Sinorhizobium terangae]MQX15123.1 transcriptional regulator [Sinorhizobium terangae]WFU47990.1 helix-turn-helix domain-containing protein [Sinorhizobium terangae]